MVCGTGLWLGAVKASLISMRVFLWIRDKDKARRPCHRLTQGGRGPGCGRPQAEVALVLDSKATRPSCLGSSPASTARWL